MSVHQSWVDLAVGESSNIRELSAHEGASGFAACGSFAILPVGCEVEGDEEEEVRAYYAHPGESSEFLSSAFSRIRHPGEVG